MFEFAVKGFSTLPRVEELLINISNGKKKLNVPEILMSNFIKYLKENPHYFYHEHLNKLLEHQKSVIRTNTRVLAEIKLSKALTGGWWQGLKLDAKNRYLYEGKDKILIIKVLKKVENSR